MKHPFRILVQLALVWCAANVSAADLKQARITKVVNEVQIISEPANAPKPAAVNDIFSLPDILRTGNASRAELTAQDETITRVGANTIFAFDPASRTINLKQGSLLFHSPAGKGGGTIRTGSATASVLGTTLIVTTTGNGGMKVLNLEGEVKVELPGRQQQLLSPGQMTFILPGSRQLAPIINFRLGELVKKSRLVEGFGAPLPSLPRIQKQIDAQNKLLKSGRATDTGLLVGDNASPNQVEVLDPKTIGTQESSVSVKALSKNAVLASSDLADKQIPVPPRRIFLNQPFTLPGNEFFNQQKFLGFAGRDITFNPDNVRVGGMFVNLMPYAAEPVFDFVASRDLFLDGSLYFVGLTGQNQLSLIAGRQLTIASGVTLLVNSGYFQMTAPGAISLDDVRIFNNLGGVGITSGSSISLDNTDIIATGSIDLSAPDSIRMIWDGDIQVGEPGDNSIITDAGSGSVELASRSGSLTVTATTIQAHYLTLNSGDSILLDASGRNLTATGPGATASFSAPNLITVNNASFANYGTVNMAANTINLSDVAFGGSSAVTLRSRLGELNVGSSMPGYVNFIRNVTYGGNPAQNYVNNGGGITVTTLH